MSKNDNIVIFPYDSHFTPILRSKRFIDSYKNIYLSSLPGFGLCGRDAGYADGGDAINILVENKFEEYFNLVNKVIFVEPDTYIEFEKVIYPRMLAAINAKKDIICLINIKDKISEIEKLCEENDVIFEYYGEKESEKVNLDVMALGELLNINIPIISVIGLSENTHKFALQLQLKEQFESMGYNVVLVGSRSYCEFLGFESFPNFMFDKNFSETEKVYCFNNYIKNIEIEKNPDAIIIGVPGGIIPYNNLVNNNFGITAFEVSQAVVPDISILSVFHEMYKPEYFERLTNLTQYRFGYDIDIINIANRQIDWVEMENAKSLKIRYSTLNPKFMVERIKECRLLTSKPIYNINNVEDAFNLVQNVKNKLIENETGIVF